MNEIPFQPYIDGTANTKFNIISMFNKTGHQHKDRQIDRQISRSQYNGKEK